MKEILNLKNSKTLMKTKNVIIYGTIRDIENHFICSFSNITTLSSYFNKVYIIIFENDSTDKTRDLLKSWQKNNCKNTTKHVLLYDNLEQQIPLRASRLAYCRNEILNYIFGNNLHNEYHYALHCDLDDRFWSIDYDSICNCFQYDLEEWDVMTCVNKNNSYYDFWALRCPQSWFNINIFSCEANNIDYSTKTGEFEKLISQSEGLIPVTSSFNGMGIYKLKSMKNCKYDASYFCDKCSGGNRGCYEDNDHIGLHKKMVENGSKLFINTKMILQSVPEKTTSTTYTKFIEGILNNIPNIKKNPLLFLLKSEHIDKSGIWLEFGTGDGTSTNIISNYYCENKTLYSFDSFKKSDYEWVGRNDINTTQEYVVEKYPLLNKNIKIVDGNFDKTIPEFANEYLGEYNSKITFMNIDCKVYQPTKEIFRYLYNKICNGCIIVFNDLVNYPSYWLHELKAFYEFVQEYNVTIEWVAMNGNFTTILPPSKFFEGEWLGKSNEMVAVKIVDNPFYASLNENVLDYIEFNWNDYTQRYDDLRNVQDKTDAWNHWITHGRGEGRICNLLIAEKETKEREQMEEIMENEFNTFDWWGYIREYDDLDHILTKEDAWSHWITHGREEGRICNLESNPREKERLENEYVSFDWWGYIKEYDDLNHILTKEDAWNHWKTNGKNENRKCRSTLSSSDEYESFDWKKYVGLYSDLKHISTKKDAWNHWRENGKKEGRNTQSDVDADTQADVDIDIENEKMDNDTDIDRMMDKLFDSDFYLNTYPDLGESLHTPEESWDHWVKYGKKEGRVCTSFNWITYLKLNQDLIKIKINTEKKAILHWIKYGKAEKRTYF